MREKLGSVESFVQVGSTFSIGHDSGAECSTTGQQGRLHTLLASVRS